MDFNEVDLLVFIKFISELTGKNFLVDNAVKGKVTIISPNQISIDEVYQVFLSALAGQGYTIIPQGNMVKIVPTQRARQDDIETGFSGTKPEVEGDRLITQIIPLKHSSANEMRKIIFPLVSKDGVLESYSPSETLIVTDYASNVGRVVSIIRELDWAQTDVKSTMVRLKHADAETAARRLEMVIESMKQKTGPNRVISVVPDKRLNGVILYAGSEETRQLLKLIVKMDQPTPIDRFSLQVVRLSNAKAEDLEKVLNNLAQKSSGKEGLITSDLKVVAEKASNSLIISSDTRDFQPIRDLITRLDQPRKQVYVETSIIEVSAEKGLDWGIKWQNIIKSQDSMFGVGTSNGPVGNTPEDLIGNLADSGFSFGMLAFPFTYGGSQYYNLGSFISASKTDDSINIISTPQLLTLENEEAKVVVGENRAFTTRQDLTTGNQAFSNYDYKDVGVTLKVTPQINESGAVRLTIYQEVSRVDGNSMEGTITPITKKRVAETTVEVENGETVVIAGLIEDADTDNISGVPGLMDIPILGWLFKTKSKGISKKNLLVFLTPRVVTKAEESKDIFFDKVKYMEELRYDSHGRIGPQVRPLYLAPLHGAD